tara:strand:- start:980 stop:1255 length:276 start_codon:yes stop_codon:yes gene_type:complete
MEIVKSRYGLDRTIEKIDNERLRVMGETQFSRQAQNDAGEVTMYDFEGGPCLSVGGDIKFQNLKWKIKSIKPEYIGHEGLGSCVLTVLPQY